MNEKDAAMENRAPAAPQDPEFRQVIREWGEALGIALVLALILRHFVVEAFKIPTKSMEPTLVGDPANGDKILVSKFVYDFWKPRRGDVIVFRFPEDPFKNYIKRLIGLPNERILIWHGDIYVNGKIWRKPPSVQRALWMPVSNDGFIWDEIAMAELRRNNALPTLDFGSYNERVSHVLNVVENWEDKHHAEKAELLPRLRLKFWSPKTPSLWASSADGLKCDGDWSATEEETVRYQDREIEDRVMNADGKLIPYALDSFRRMHRVDDLAVRFRVRAKQAGGEILAVLGDARHRFMARIPVGPPGKVKIQANDRINGQMQFLEGPELNLQPGKLYSVSLMNVDNAVSLEINRRRVIEHPYEQPGPRREHLSVRTDVEIGVFRAPAVFTDIRLERDIHYIDDMNGMTSPNAEWQLGDKEYFVLGDNSANSKDSRLWQTGPTVPEENLIGEAFMVFWPPKRLRIIR